MVDIQPTTTQPISDDQELAKVLAGVNQQADDALQFEETPAPIPAPVAEPVADPSRGRSPARRTGYSSAGRDVAPLVGVETGPASNQTAYATGLSTAGGAFSGKPQLGKTLGAYCTNGQGPGKSRR